MVTNKHHVNKLVQENSRRQRTTSFLTSYKRHVRSSYFSVNNSNDESLSLAETFVPLGRVRVWSDVKFCVIFLETKASFEGESVMALVG